MCRLLPDNGVDTCQPEALEILDQFDQIHYQEDHPGPGLAEHGRAAGFEAVLANGIQLPPGHLL